MAPEHVIHIIIFGLSAILSMAFPISMRVKGRTTPLIYSLFFLLSLIILFMLHPFITYPTGILSWYYVYMEYMSACFIGLNWFIFTVYYSRQTRPKRWLGPLFLLPLLTYGFMIINDFGCRMDINKLGSFLPYTQNWYAMTPLYINGMPLGLHYGILSVCFLAGAAFFLKGFYRLHGRIKTILFLSTAIIPFAVNIFPLSAPGLLHRFLLVDYNFRSWLSLEFQYFIYLLALLGLTVLSFKYCVVDLVPIALRKLVDNMGTMVVMVDSGNKILDFNRALDNEFSAGRHLKLNEPLIKLIDSMQTRSAQSPDGENVFAALKSPAVTQFSGELGIVIPQIRFYAVTIQPILFARQEILGRIITFSDITDYRNLVEELHQKNETLTIMNQELKEHSATVVELAVVKERNRFARDIHDTLGHTMTLLIALLEVGKVDLSVNPASTGEKLDKSIEIARAGLQEICRSLEGLTPGKWENRSLISILQNIFADFRTSGLNIEFNVDGGEKPCKTPVIETVFRVCQEALTNSLRHGQAKQATILLRFDSTSLKLFIFDDGCGCQNIIKGRGLSGMEQRVKDLRGTLVYGSDGERGFNIRVELPLNA